MIADLARNMALEHNLEVKVLGEVQLYDCHLIIISLDLFLPLTVFVI